MKIVTISQSATPPITVAEFKAYAAIIHDDDDAMLPGIVAAAVQAVENHTGLYLSPRTVEIRTASSLPEIPVGPVVDVLSVRAITRLSPRVESDVAFSYGAADGALAIDYAPGALAYAVTVDAGYRIGELPPALRTAALMLATDLYENRGAQVAGVTIAPNSTLGFMLFPFRANLGV